MFFSVGLHTTHATMDSQLPQKPSDVRDSKGGERSFGKANSKTWPHYRKQRRVALSD